MTMNATRLRLAERARDHVMNRAGLKPLCFALLLGSAAVARVTLPPATTTHLESRAGAYSASLTEVTSPEGLEKWREEGWGPVNKRLLVSEFALKCKGKTIWVPLSAYADLGSPSQLRVVVRKDGCVVMLKGGDAGGAYSARIQVSGDEVTSREVHSNELPESYERTTYHYPNSKM